MPPPEVRQGGIRVLVVKREKARCLLNHDALVDAISAMEEVGSVRVFDVRQEEGGPFPWRHWKEWWEVDVVVAPHGAALANTVAMPAWGHVVEVLAGKQPNFMFAGVSLKQGLRYSAVIAHDMEHHGCGTAPLREIAAAVKQAAAEITALAAEPSSMSVQALCR